MFMSILRLALVVLLSLSTCDGWALTGPETARQLNQRLAATPTQCVGGKPVDACSGVLLLPMLADHPQPFWHHDAEAVERGSERFRFLRRDLDQQPLRDKVGYILHDGFTAQSQGKGYVVIDDGGTTPGERLVRNWDQQAPAQLAVQALYYDPGDADSLLRAQAGQLAYFQATQQWLPLVRYAPGPGAGAFGFSTQEQLYHGYQLAERLNARYADTAPCADGRAGYYCNGVIVRTVGSGDFHAWNPSPNSIRINGVAFTYVRADTGATQALYSKGYVIRELSAPAVRPFELGCVYPADGATNDSTALGACTYKNVCAALGVIDVASWKARYERLPRSSCALGTTPADLQLLLDIRKSVPKLDPWNELVMVTWPQDIGEQLPIEAFFYSLSSLYEKNGLEGGRHIQRDYLEQSRRYLPLLKVDLADPGGRPFHFDPADQGGQ